MSSLMSVTEVGARLGVSRIRVHQYIADGRLPAQRVGNAFVIRESDLKKIVVQPKGRPKSSVRND